eukprot:14664816-Ditylum_brightwellii.AAC.1
MVSTFLINNLVDAMGYVDEQFDDVHKFPNSVFQVDSNGVSKSEEGNILAQSLIGKVVRLIKGDMKEIVLGRESRVSNNEEEEELIMTCVNSVRSMVDVKRTDTLVDVRCISKYFDKCAKFHNFIF